MLSLHLNDYLIKTNAVQIIPAPNNKIISQIIKLSNYQIIDKLVKFVIWRNCLQDIKLLTEGF